MGTLFKSKIGSVVALDEPGAQCSVQFLGLNPDITFGVQRSIITRVTMQHSVNVQFLHTLGSLVYVYVFGDRMGQVHLSGLAFRCECPTGAELGAERMLTWYKTNRASRRSKPVMMTIGNQVIEGFVTNFTEDVVDPSTDLVQWGVTMATLPDDLTTVRQAPRSFIFPETNEPPLFVPTPTFQLTPGSSNQLNPYNPYLPANPGSPFSPPII